MKTKITPTVRATLVALLVGATPALVAAPASKQNNPGRHETKAQSATARDDTRTMAEQRIRPAAEDPRGRSAGDLLGMDVYGSGDEKLGDLHDLVVDANTGKVSYAIVASGGILGFGSNLRAVPIEACNVSGDRVSIDINETRWKQAPVFTEEQLVSLNRADRTSEIDQFFGDKPPGRDDTSAQENRESPRQFVLVSKVRGKDVLSNGREIGEIEDVIVKLDSRSAAALLDAEDDFVGDDRRYLVPFGKLNGFNTDDLNTNLGRQDFANAGESTDASWANPVGYVSTLYVWPMYTPGAVYDPDGYAANDASRSAGRDHDGAMLGDDRSRTDRDAQASARPPVDAVRKAVQAETPDGQRNIHVIAEEDRVVLRGTVPNEDLKERIEDRAEEAAPGWDIESELRVAQSDR